MTDGAGSAPRPGEGVAPPPPKPRATPGRIRLTGGRSVATLPRVRLGSLAASATGQPMRTVFSPLRAGHAGHVELMSGPLGRPTLFVMEGGYLVEAIGLNAVGVLTGFEAGRSARRPR